MKQILWTGFTILLTVAIILFCTYFPGALWDMTFTSADVQQSVSLVLPNMDTLIKPEDVNIVPPYFPSATMEKQYPNGKYELLDTNTSTYESEEGQAFISGFSKLVNGAILQYWGMSCTTQIISQYTDLWRVFANDHPSMVGFYASCTMVLQQEHILWQVTAYGSPDGLTHLSRTPYTTTEEEKSLADLPNHETVLSYTDDAALNQLLNTVNSKQFHPETFHTYFNGPFMEDLEQILADENYSFINMGNHIYKLYLWSDTYEKNYEIMAYMVRTGSKATALFSLLSIRQTQ